MTSEMVMELVYRMMTLATVVSAPMLIVGIIVGLIVAIFMAATQIQEASLNFVPKLVAIGFMMMLVGPWMLDTMVVFTVDLFTELADLAPGRLE
jgi:flagellar biosynthetic protein FliQ